MAAAFGVATRREALTRLSSGVLAAAIPLPPSAPHPVRDAPFASPLSEERRPGRYHCRACGLAVFDARDKYFTSTGWPTFSAALRGAIRAAPPVAEIRCAGCARPLGDLLVLRQGAPALRYSLNGSALAFAPTVPLDRDTA